MAMDLGAGTKKGARPEMNVTPLVDVVLVLLIIFMVITPLLTKQFWIFLPTKPEQERPTPTPSAEVRSVVVTVDAAGKVFINHDEVALEALPERLRRVLAAKGDRTIFFDAHDDAPFEVAVRALDASRGGGATTIAVATGALAESR
jgi:biopolymer transport protein ExbD/biopolymer transport protein TolR